MDNGLELTEDGFELHPRPSQYRVAALVGLVGVLLSVFVVGMVFRAWLAIPSFASSARMSTGLVVVGATLVLGLMTAVGYVTSRPLTLTVTRSQRSLLGGTYRRRVEAVACDGSHSWPRGSTR